MILHGGGRMGEPKLEQAADHAQELADAKAAMALLARDDTPR